MSPVHIVRSETEKLSKRLRVKLVVAFMAALCQSVSAYSETYASAAESQKGWRLTQTAKMQGDCQTIITEGAIKLGIPKNGSYVVSIAPFDRAVFYSTKTKKVCRVSSQSVRNAFESAEASINGFVLHDMPIVRKRSGTFKGLKTDIYETPPSFATVQIGKANAKIIPKRMPKSGILETTQMLVKNTLAWKIACVFFGAPEAKGYPLSLNYKDIDNDLHVYLKTIKIETVPVSSADFAIPGDLRVVKTPLEVNAGETDDEAIMLMLPSSPKRH